MSVQPAEHGLEPLRSVKDVARYFGVPVNTVYKWRQDGYGPKGFRVGKHLKFRVEDIRAFEDEQLAAEGH